MVECARDHTPALYMFANVQSLRNKMKELTECVRFLSEYRNACIFALAKTWLRMQNCNSSLKIEDFGQPTRLERDPHKTCKVQGGGMCLYVNTRWFKTVVVGETVCSPDNELLTVSLCPFYRFCKENFRIYLSQMFISNLKQAWKMQHPPSLG